MGGGGEGEGGCTGSGHSKITATTRAAVSSSIHSRKCASRRGRFWAASETRETASSRKSRIELAQRCPPLLSVADPAMIAARPPSLSLSANQTMDEEDGSRLARTLARMGSFLLADDTPVDDVPEGEGMNDRCCCNAGGTRVGCIDPCNAGGTSIGCMALALAAVAGSCQVACAAAAASKLDVASAVEAILPSSGQMA